MRRRALRSCATGVNAGDGASARSRAAASRTPPSSPTTKPAADDGAMPAAVPVNTRASVTAGFAKHIDCVNQ
ncbi:MAG: hypothetical protein FJ137_02210 [Deltaproteobacteria bacterium]|nr:hypothetical protein [Deltaproteobacteria bacterium]